MRIRQVVARWLGARPQPVAPCGAVWPAGAASGVTVRCDHPAGPGHPAMHGGPMPEHMPPALAAWAAAYRAHHGVVTDRLAWASPVEVHDIHGSRGHEPGTFLRLDGGTLDVGGIEPDGQAAWVEAVGPDVEVRFLPDVAPTPPAEAAGQGDEQLRTMEALARQHGLPVDPPVRAVRWDEHGVTLEHPPGVECDPALDQCSCGRLNLGVTRAGTPPPVTTEVEQVDTGPLVRPPDPED